MIKCQVNANGFPGVLCHYNTLALKIAVRIVRSQKRRTGNMTFLAMHTWYLTKQ